MYRTSVAARFQSALFSARTRALVCLIRAYIQPRVARSPRAAANTYAFRLNA